MFPDLPGRGRPVRGLAGLLLAGLLQAACATPERATAPTRAGSDALSTASLPAIRFAELHYDNVGTDAGEAIELSGPAGASLAGWSVVLYNGSVPGAAVTYNTRALSGTIPSTGAGSCGARGVVVLAYPTDGIQNGGNDGMALVDPQGQVVELLSYEGVFTASNGPAAGMTSTDIGVSQNSAPIGLSLQRRPDGGWNTPATSTFGSCNDGTENPVPPDVGPLDRVTTTPATAAVEVGATVTIGAVAEDAEGDDITAGTIAWTDEGSPAVTITPSADGRTATVRGDAPATGVRVIASLVLDGILRADTTLVTVNVARPPGSTTRIVFSGFNAAPLPPGYEDQIFARAFSGPAAADSIVGMTYTWRALTPFATIDQNGVVRGVADGRALFEVATTDGFVDTAFVNVATPVDPTSARYANHLEFGRPVDATPDDDYLLTYDEYVSSYNAARGQPNWIAYNLEATHRGPAERCDCFTSPELPAGFARVSTADYTGSGYTRGHLVMSEDRTTGPNPPATSVDNARTFLFANIIPQSAANNGGPWLELENYLGALATQQNKEIYIYAGGAAYQGTLNNAGKVAIPSRTWKIALVLDRDRGLGDVRSAADVEVIAIDMPNLLADNALLAGRTWRDFVVPVDQVEQLTGYDFLAELPDEIEVVLEAQRAGVRALGMDVQPTRISLATTATVNVVLYSGASFDAAAVNAADLRLVVNGTAVAPISRGGVVNTSVRDVNGDGRADRVVGFATSALRDAGLATGPAALVLRPAGASPAWEALDGAPATVVP